MQKRETNNRTREPLARPVNIKRSVDKKSVLL